MKQIVIEYFDDNDNALTFKKTLYRPKGKISRKKLPMLLDFMTKLQESNVDINDTEDVNRMIMVIKKIWGENQFEEELVPFVLQMYSPEEQKILNEQLTSLEILEPFMEAAQWTMEQAFSKPEVKEALKKSKAETATRSKETVVEAE